MVHPIYARPRSGSKQPPAMSISGCNDPNDDHRIEPQHASEGQCIRHNPIWGVCVEGSIAVRQVKERLCADLFEHILGQSRHIVRLFGPQGLVPDMIEKVMCFQSGPAIFDHRAKAIESLGVADVRTEELKELLHLSQHVPTSGRHECRMSLLVGSRPHPRFSISAATAIASRPISRSRPVTGLWKPTR